jgi:putative PIN family toxin of toxin-antitoxin system
VGKKVRVVFDTNVWVSIFIKKTLSEEFSRAKHETTVYISEDIILEISKVLVYPKIEDILRKAGAKQQGILRAIEADSTIVKSKVKLRIIEKDAKDNMILECAKTAEANFVVSGDKHLLKLGKLEKTKIVAPREFFNYVD